MHIIYVIVLIVFILPCTTYAAPSCYEQAVLPAHVWALEMEKPKADKITALAADGEQCVYIPLWDNKPLLRSEMFVPFGILYATYAEAVHRKDVAALSRIYTWLRPTPRPFPLWVALLQTDQGPPQPWGVQGLTNIIRMLHPKGSAYAIQEFTPDRVQEPNFVKRNWALLYIYIWGAPYCLRPTAL